MEKTLHTRFAQSFGKYVWGICYVQGPAQAINLADPLRFQPLEPPSVWGGVGEGQQTREPINKVISDTDKCLKENETGGRDKKMS